MQEQIYAALLAHKVVSRFAYKQGGPHYDAYHFEVDAGPQVRRALRLEPDLSIALGVRNVRVTAGPAANVISVEVPRADRQFVELTAADGGGLTFPVGMAMAGRLTVDLAKLPHLIVAGSTGSGKSVFVNCLLVSLLRLPPERLQLLLIDPKRVELAPYGTLPHLLAPVAHDVPGYMRGLRLVERIMGERYEEMQKSGCRGGEEMGYSRIVVVIDEMADLMLGCPAAGVIIVRLAQLGRAAGIHLVCATQRPDAKIITGIIKANIPGRVAFAVPSGTDSRVILDRTGAEKLLGSGDMLFVLPGKDPIRAQGYYVDDAAIQAAVQRWPARVTEPVTAHAGPLVIPEPPAPPATPRHPRELHPALPGCAVLVFCVILLIMRMIWN